MNLLLLVQDSVKIDTTGFDYRVGYTFASWLPFLVIVFIFLMIIRKRYRFEK